MNRSMKNVDLQLYLILFIFQFQCRPGLMSLLKEGGKHFTGLEEATYRNIDACRKLAAITRTSLGPNSKHINNSLF